MSLGSFICYVIPIIQFRHTVKEFQFNYLTLIILINIAQSFAHSYMVQVLPRIGNSSIKHQLFVYTRLNYQTVLFLTIQFCTSHSIQPIERTLSDATISGQSRPENNGNEGLLHITQSSKTGASPSDCLVSQIGHSFWEGSYPSAEIQSVYSSTPAD